MTIITTEIIKTSIITRTSQSGCLVSYTGHSLGKSYTSAEKLLVYSTAPADWATSPDKVLSMGQIDLFDI